MTGEVLGTTTIEENTKGKYWNATKNAQNDAQKMFLFAQFLRKLAAPGIEQRRLLFILR